MEKLTLDFGVREFEINGNGVLRFNPGDPNVYSRLVNALDKIKGVENWLVEQSKAVPQNDGAAVLRLMAQADEKMKDILAWVFGGENDFDKLLCGVNLMAVCTNGERAITNLLNALTPIVQEGAENFAKQQVNTAVDDARLARAQREQ